MMRWLETGDQAIARLRLADQVTTLRRMVHFGPKVGSQSHSLERQRLPTLSQRAGADPDRTLRSLPSHHETIEECRELLIAIERKNVRDVLVGPHDHHAPPFAIDATHGEDVIAAFEVGAEHLFVVAKSEPSLPRQKEGRHGLDGDVVMALLEHRADIEHRVDVLA